MTSDARRSLLALALALSGSGAQASDFFCNNYVAGTPLQHFQCVQTTVGPGTPMVLSGDQAGSGPLGAASVSAGSGPFASSSTASATAAPGLLRGFASASMLGGSIDGAQAVGRSDAWFADGATVMGAPGAAVGTPVSLRFTVDVAGGFAGGGFFTALSEASVELFAGIPGRAGSNIHTGATINKFTPLNITTMDVSAFVGDTFEMLMKLHVAAGAINDATAGNASSIADVGNTSHLYIDVLSGNASVVGSSGHLYATAAVTAVPEPAEWALLLAGLGVVGIGTRRRA